ncbi:bifunctional hydroxymethylpyrimidine kinase/phosphomethylpyrimidine kinase [Rothia nasimurium]|uniref:bifunctional hydroxymethylpyrimidine kinase/phosphomethylpyrimidine kinase n=1 Tax=Rothia nasimurium TaxID=85336 RepID=UPI001F22E00B|nr:bifunctional hydroxymethylpyrimidine kinase/phosphomethylpyrimidine kinase [Rothia nasimurium]
MDVHWELLRWGRWNDEEPRLATTATHGTGCSLSAALATRLGAGDGLPDTLPCLTVP